MTFYTRIPTVAGLSPLPTSHRLLLLSAAIASVLLNSSPALAQEAATPAGQVQLAQADQTQDFAIAAQPLGSALDRFSEQTGIAFAYTSTELEGIQSPGVSGRMAPRQALVQLLAGTGISYRFTGGDTVVLSKADQSGAMMLPPVTVTGETLEGTTEGTESYTTGATSTATRLDLSLRHTPQSVSVITRQQMDDQGLLDLESVLRQTPGVTVRQENSEGSVFYARGFQIYNFQYDGVPSLSTDGGNVRDNYSIGNSIIYDRVEVLKGATGLVNSAGYPSGVINLVRKRPARDFQGHISGGAGSWDTYRSELDVSGPLSENGALRGRAVAATRTQNSFIDYLESEQNVFYAILEGDLSADTTVSIGYDYQKNNNDGTSNNMHPAFYSDGRTVKLSRSFNAADRWAYRNQEIQRVFTDIEHRFANDWSLKAAATYRKYKSRELIAGLTASATVDANTNQVSHGFYSGAGTIFNTDTDEKSIDLYAKGPFSLMGRNHDLVFGYNYSKSEAESNRFDNDTTDTSVDIFNWNNNSPLDRSAFEWWSTFNVDVRQKIAYATTVLKPIDELSVILGARVVDYEWEQRNVFGNGRRPIYGTRVTGETIPYAGITYDLDAYHTLYVSYTDVFKPQAYNFDANDKQLDPLTGKSYEIGAKGEYFDGRLNTSAALFVIKQDNVAQLDPNATGLTPNGNTAYIAVQGVTTKGIELEASGELLPGWQLHGGYTYQESHDGDDNRAATGQPQHLFKLATNYRLPGDWNRITVGGNLHWQSLTYTTQTVAGAPRKFEQSAYGVVGLTASYDITANLKANMILDNLFDKHYYSGLNTDFRGGMYYGNPRNVMFNVKYDF